MALLCLILSFDVQPPGGQSGKRRMSHQCSGCEGPLSVSTIEQERSMQASPKENRPIGSADWKGCWWAQALCLYRRPCAPRRPPAGLR